MARRDRDVVADDLERRSESRNILLAVKASRFYDTGKKPCLGLVYSVRFLVGENDATQEKRRCVRIPTFTEML